MSKGKILVVDDDRLVLATLVHGLTQAGYDVLSADNGDEAILLARQQKPDLALLDIRMEGKSGFDVAQYLRDHEAVPFMFLSAFSDAATLAQVTALGAVAYLVKPLDIQQIVPAVDAAMARPEVSANKGRPSAEGASPARLSEAAPTPARIASDPAFLHPVALVVGALMQRHAWTREVALQWLREQADREGVSVMTQAERLLVALELFARHTD